MSKKLEVEALNLRRSVSVVALARGEPEALSSLLGAVFGAEIGGSQLSWTMTDGVLRLSFTTRYGTAFCAHCGDPMPCCEKVPKT
mgnify:CR=1 FL=1